LWAQMEESAAITKRRLDLWNTYHSRFKAAEADGRVRRPVIPGDCVHNAHMYYLLLPSPAERTRLIAELQGIGIGAIFHYVPLHSSPGGRRFGRSAGELPVTDRVAASLLRLPMYIELGADQDTVVDAVHASLGAARARSAAAR
jgi:dTDP-4-amino-4,6-dideoxygalactose transaminase